MLVKARCGNPGDVLVYSGRGCVSYIIRIDTCSPYSHVAVLAMVTQSDLERYMQRPCESRRWSISPEAINLWRDRLLVFESTTLTDFPCSLSGKKIRGVQAHELDSVDSYQGRVWRIPMTVPLLPSQSQRLTDALLDRIAVEYDDRGAILAGTRILRWLTPYVRDRSKLYCEELVGEVMQCAKPDFPRIEPGRLSPGEFAWAMRETGHYRGVERIR